MSKSTRVKEAAISAKYSGIAKGSCIAGHSGPTEDHGSSHGEADLIT